MYLLWVSLCIFNIHIHVHMCMYTHTQTYTYIHKIFLILCTQFYALPFLKIHIYILEVFPLYIREWHHSLLIWVVVYEYLLFYWTSLFSMDIRSPGQSITLYPHLFYIIYACKILIGIAELLCINVYLFPLPPAGVNIPIFPQTH